jgi:hypothetical protein
LPAGTTYPSRSTSPLTSVLGLPRNKTSCDSTVPAVSAITSSVSAVIRPAKKGVASQHSTNAFVIQDLYVTYCIEILKVGRLCPWPRPRRPGAGFEP